MQRHPGGLFFGSEGLFYGSASALLKVSRRPSDFSTREKEIPGRCLGLMRVHPEGLFFRFKGSFFRFNQGKRNPEARPGINWSSFRGTFFPVQYLFFGLTREKGSQMPFGAQIQNSHKGNCPLGPKFIISVRTMPFGTQIQNSHKEKCPLGPKFRIAIRKNALWGPNSEFP